ncbi:MAG: VOC family protein [Acidobacteria bacterium]|nr:VOC family protein [Acidobacteriota bacterium]
MSANTPGNFCWFELGTSDFDGAKAFYGELFGWTVDVNTDAGMPYGLVSHGGNGICGMYELAPEMRDQGIPPHWMTYVATPDADATAAKAAELGAIVMAGPFDVHTYGRMAAMADPTGAHISIWQPKDHCGSDVIGPIHSFCWSELWTRDRDAAETFYTNLFGWGLNHKDTGPMPYGEWINGGIPIGGMLQMNEQFGDAPPCWMPYVHVADCDATVAKVKELGGTPMMDPMDIPDVGRFALFQDAQGATLAIVTLAMPDE